MLYRDQSIRIYNDNVSILQDYLDEMFKTGIVLRKVHSLSAADMITALTTWLCIHALFLRRDTETESRAESNPLNGSCYNIK